MNLLNILLVIVGISLPLLIERIKEKPLNDNFKLLNLSKILAILLPYYSILIFYYKVIAADIGSFYFYTLIRIALTLSFIVAVLRYSPLGSFMQSLLNFPRFKRRSTFYIIILFFFAFTSFGAYLMVDLFPRRVGLQLSVFVVFKAIIENLFFSAPISVLTELFSIGGEEIVYRYFAINTLRQKLKKNSVIIISSLIWTLTHGELSFGIFVLGIFLGYLYYETGSLSLCIVLHFLFNFGVLTEPFFLFYKRIGYIEIPAYQYALSLFAFQILLYHMAEMVFVKTNPQKQI